MWARFKPVKLRELRFRHLSSIPILACPLSANTQINVHFVQFVRDQPRCSAVKRDDHEDEQIYGDLEEDIKCGVVMVAKMKIKNKRHGVGDLIQNKFVGE